MGRGKKLDTHIVVTEQKLPETVGTQSSEVLNLAVAKYEEKLQTRKSEVEKEIEEVSKKIKIMNESVRKQVRDFVDKKAPVIFKPIMAAMEKLEGKKMGLDITTDPYGNIESMDTVHIGGAIGHGIRKGTADSPSGNRGSLTAVMSIYGPIAIATSNGRSGIIMAIHDMEIKLPESIVNLKKTRAGIMKTRDKLHQTVEELNTLLRNMSKTQRQMQAQITEDAMQQTAEGRKALADVEKLVNSQPMP